ncbi:hypothetical protein LCGC14_3140510 [marine sediment metagenome]|uniref:Uncharacterized protein n=1 Tax=marine sediment metagenome TaxID=412755 RepID=A0A0F8VX57_9ZZZZ
MMENNEIDWSPRSLPGGVYCSPGCGRGCTKAEYDLAVRDGNALAQRMGEGWVSEVWENLGWHYRAEKGVASVSFTRWHSGSEYTVYFYTVPPVVTSAETPEDALGFAVQEARGNELRIATDCAALQ